ncbi:MAG: hypothetical protein GXO93_04070 [FCB group bacterium]|nr:hypothetical protein [FCB group bacterium]
MIRIMHILRELGKNIYRNPGTTFSALLSTTLLFLLFDFFWIAAGTSERFYQDLLSDLNMEVFVSEDVPDSSLTSMDTPSSLRSHIKSIEGVQSLTYISKEKAREQLSQLVGVDLLVGYDTNNPLPRSFVLTFTPDYLKTSKLAAIEKEILALKGVSQVFYSQNWLKKVEKTREIVLKLGMILGILIILTVLISSTNNMRLTARARAIGFQQMRLSGAGKLFLSFPFLIEGFLVGALSAGLGWLIIFYLRQKVVFTKIIIVFPPANDIIIFCILVAVLGSVSGYLGIRRLLKL